MTKLYGFTADDDVLTQLLALNESIALERPAASPQPRPPGAAGIADAKRTTGRIEPPIRLDEIDVAT